MSDKKNFFDLSSQQSLVMGLSWGVALISIIGFVVMLNSAPSADDKNNLNAQANTNINANTNAAPAQPTAPTADVTKLSPVTDQDYIRGNKNAKITLIEISDFQCPYCQRHTPTMDKILEDYGDQVRLVWRNFPLSSIHPYAQKAAEASECAGEQGKFWEMHDLMFVNQSALDTPSLKIYAGQIGLDQTKFNDCLDSGKYESKIKKQVTEATAAGISGTPGTFVNGELVKGAYPYETFKQIIDKLLE